jgi:hypothetical protein
VLSALLTYRQKKHRQHGVLFGNSQLVGGFKGAVTVGASKKFHLKGSVFKLV